MIEGVPRVSQIIVSAGPIGSKSDSLPIRMNGNQSIHIIPTAILLLAAAEERRSGTYPK
jgi:hypothetical protein